jgi:predicted ATPase/DNA-binding SARP family transcriptional activator
VDLYVRRPIPFGTRRRDNSAVTPIAPTSDPPATRNPQSQIRVTLLRPLTVEVDGRSVDLGRPQNELLLARLALAAPSPISVDTLIAALWDERPPPSARKNLQKCISELRRHLGSWAIRTERSGYVLAVPTENIDVHAFDTAVVEARSARALDKLEEAWGHYEHADGMWGDRALDGLNEIGFVADESRRLDDVRIAVVEEQLDVGLELGKHAELVPKLGDLVRRHPLREHLWALLMLALYRSGRQADALATYRRLHDILEGELGVEPSPEIKKLEERILLHDPGLSSAPRSAGLHKAPRGFTSFVGRDEELAALKTVILEGSRLVTVIGSGGSGKTRLAVEVARSIADSYQAGAWFADLAPIAEESEITSAVGTVFGLYEEPGVSALETLLGFLEGAHLLLILDNCEHLGQGVGALATEILGTSSSVALLATSREPLGLVGEQLFPLAPMPVPPENETDPHRLEAIDSVRLFVDRAGAADPAFRLSSEVAPLVADVCRRLDGIPLAIELAARQLHVLGPQELRRGLLDHLRRGAPGEPDERHRTMEAAIGWSFRQLSDEQRELFLALSAFGGSFSAEAARHIWGVADRSIVARVLSDLVGCSMVVRVGDEGDNRYRLLEPIRDYATRRAAHGGLSDSLRRRHCEWVLAVFNECTPIRGPREREYLKRLSAEHHHLITALDWAVAHDAELALRLLVAGVPYTQMVVYRFRWAETASLAIAEDSKIDKHLRAAALALGSEALAENFEHDKVREWAAAALELAEQVGDEALAGFALVSLGWSHRTTGALERAEKYFRSAIERFNRADNRIGEGHALHSLSFVLMAQGRYQATLETSMAELDVWLRLRSDWGAGRAWWHVAAAHTREGAYDEARDAVTRALRYFEGFDDVGSFSHVRAVEGDIARLSGQFERARDVYLSCLQGFQEVGDRRCIASIFRNLALVALHLGSDDEAVSLLQASLRRRYDMGDLAGVTECFEGLGLLGHRMGRSEQAVTMLAAAERLRGETRASAPIPESTEIRSSVESLRLGLGDDRFWELWNGARELSLERLMGETQSMFLGEVTSRPG